MTNVGCSIEKLWKGSSPCTFDLYLRNDDVTKLCNTLLLLSAARAHWGHLKHVAADATKAHILISYWWKEKKDPRKKCHWAGVIFVFVDWLIQVTVWQKHVSRDILSFVLLVVCCSFKIDNCIYCFVEIAFLCGLYLSCLDIIINKLSGDTYFC